MRLVILSGLHYKVITEHLRTATEILESCQKKLLVKDELRENHDQDLEWPDVAETPNLEDRLAGQSSQTEVLQVQTVSQRVPAKEVAQESSPNIRRSGHSHDGYGDQTDGRSLVNISLSLSHFPINFRIPILALSTTLKIQKTMIFLRTTI